MSYTIIKDWNFSGLVEKVNEGIADGWKPLGGVSYASGDYIQAMILEKKLD